MENFGDKLKVLLLQYLRQEGVVGERFPICQDVEDKWQNILSAYMPDGVREYNEYPMVSLGWIMFVGMAMAKYWDVDWEKYSFKDNIYETLREQRGFDEMDEYILEDVLEFDEEKCNKVTDIVAECACITNTFLRNQNIEPGTKAAVEAYIECLHQMYLMGMAMQLNAMGYKMLGLN
ncbi:MAG: hypothetical protein J6R17_09780 [Bacteroidales bacterium]|nr:hypothetical protein [Bacteroidales bacterium]